MTATTTTTRMIIAMTDNLIADLASLVRRLGYALKRTGENDKLVHQAVEFLKRHDLGGSVVRVMDKVPPENLWFSNNEQAIRWLRDEARQWHDDNPSVAAHLVEAAMMFEKATKP